MAEQPAPSANGEDSGGSPAVFWHSHAWPNDQHQTTTTDMTDTAEAFLRRTGAHRSIRLYRDGAIDLALLNRVLVEAPAKTLSSGNLSMISVLRTSDPGCKKKAAPRTADGAALLTRAVHGVDHTALVAMACGRHRLRQAPDNTPEAQWKTADVIPIQSPHKGRA